MGGWVFAISLRLICWVVCVLLVISFAGVGAGLDFACGLVGLCFLDLVFLTPGV